MLHKKFIGGIALAFALLATLACKSKAKNEINNSSDTSIKQDIAANTDANIFTAIIDGKPYAGKLNHATQSLNYANSGNNVFTIESFASSDATAAATTPHFVLLIHFTGNHLAAGTYNFETGALAKPFSYNKGSYSDGSVNHYEFNPAKGGGSSLVIANIDESKELVSGTFSGIAVSGTNKIEITQGRFSNLPIISGN